MTCPHDATSSNLLALLRRWLGRVRGTDTASADALELRGMSDHELNDLGIGRCEIQGWSRRNGPTDRPGTRESAWTHAEQRQHDGLEHLGLRFFADPRGAVDHVALGMQGRCHVKV